jgi:hypothetical protein
MFSKRVPERIGARVLML